MRIAVKQTLCPFSHRPGTRCLIPRTTWEAQVFPEKALLRDLASDQMAEVDLPFGGAFEGFTMALNLELGRIEVFSKRKGCVFLSADVHPAIKEVAISPSKKRLSLGVSKKQDWDLIERRGDMAEVFPFWLRLAEWIPERPLPQKIVGTMHLLKEGRLDDFFQAGFEGMLCPRFHDHNYLGLVEERAIPKGVSPIGLIHLGARWIESLFFREGEEGLYFLPTLPPAFHAGRFLHLETTHGDQIDIEWSKKSLKKVILRPGAVRTTHFVLQRKLKRFRVRTDLRKRGVIVSAKESLELKPNQVLYCDRFNS